MANFMSDLDANQVLRSAYDDALNRIRVDAEISATIGAIEVIIDHADDSIRLGDGTDLVTTTTVGGNVGLDVNIVNTSLPTGTASSPTISNLSAPSSGVEVSQVIPTGTKRFNMKSRKLSEMQFSYTLGTSGTSFITVPSGASYEEQGLDLTAPITIYVQTDKNTNVVEFVFWS